MAANVFFFLSTVESNVNFDADVEADAAAAKTALSPALLALIILFVIESQLFHCTVVLECGCCIDLDLDLDADLDAVLLLIRILIFHTIRTNTMNPKGKEPNCGDGWAQKRFSTQALEPSS